MLHIVSQSLSDPVVLERFAPGDAVLFIRNAVIGLSSKGRLSGRLSDLQCQCRLYVLQPDLEVRGIATETLTRGIELIDYAGFVALTVEHPQIHSWC